METGSGLIGDEPFWWLLPNQGWARGSPKTGCWCCQSRAGESLLGHAIIGLQKEELVG